MSYPVLQSQWKGYNDTLIEQVNTSLDYDHNQIQKVETYMKNFYLLQKQALERNVIETRGMGYFLDELYSHLADYYNTVTSTTLDNPGESECVAEAKTSLDTTVNASKLDIMFMTRVVFILVFCFTVYTSGFLTCCPNVV